MTCSPNFIFRASRFREKKRLMQIFIFQNCENFLRRVSRRLRLGVGRHRWDRSAGIQTGAHEERVVVVTGHSVGKSRLGQVFLVLPRLGDPVSLSG